MDNTDCVIWIPERDGHAPLFWEDGMLWCLSASYPKLYDNGGYCLWQEGREYCVSPEAVTGLAVDDTRNDAELNVTYLLPGEKVFDPEAWLAEGRANADKLPAGVVLPEHTDWADTYAAEILEMYVNVSARVINVEVADFLRTHCQPREVSNG